MNRMDLEAMTEGRKTISISNDTYRDLAKLGDLSETFDDVIRRLIKEHNDNERVRTKK